MVFLQAVGHCFPSIHIREKGAQVRAGELTVFRVAGATATGMLPDRAYADSGTRADWIGSETSFSGDKSHVMTREARRE